MINLKKDLKVSLQNKQLGQTSAHREGKTNMSRRPNPTVIRQLHRLRTRNMDGMGNKTGKLLTVIFFY